MRLPDFYIIGAAKAGTTSLYSLLATHPDVFCPQTKEPEFFARDELYKEGIASYAKIFEAARENQIIGEASTIYSLSPFFAQTASRIYQHTPAARLIYVMREPISRAFSFYKQLIKSYQKYSSDYSVNRTFEEFIFSERNNALAPKELVFSPSNWHLPDDPDLCLAGSEYLHQIEAYLKFFPRQQFLFLTFEDFLADKVATLKKVTDFLEITDLPVDSFSSDASRQNVSRDYFREAANIAELKKLASRYGPFWKARTLVPKGVRKKLAHLYVSKVARNTKLMVEPLEMKDTTRVELYKRFGSSFDELATLTELDLSKWR